MAAVVVIPIPTRTSARLRSFLPLLSILLSFWLEGWIGFISLVSVVMELEDNFLASIKFEVAIFYARRCVAPVLLR